MLPTLMEEGNFVLASNLPFFLAACAVTRLWQDSSRRIGGKVFTVKGYFGAHVEVHGLHQRTTFKPCQQGCSRQFEGLLFSNLMLT